MVCPSCGKYVAGAKTACEYCGAALQMGGLPSSNPIPPADVGTMPDTSADISRQRRDATACLLLGLFSFAALPASFAIDRFEDTLSLDVATALYMAALMTAFGAGVAALVLGRRVNHLTRRTTPGMVLGAVGAGLWSLSILTQIATIHTRYSFHPSPYAIGSLKTISTATVTYFCWFGHGFPLKLSNLGCDPSKRETSDQAAGLIDEILASGTKSGYRFSYVAGPVDSQGRVLTYTVHADPLEKWAGAPHYFTDQSGVIRQQSKRQANVSSPPLQGDSGDWGRSSDGTVDCSEVLKFYPSPP